MKKTKRYDFLGFIIEKGCMGWFVLDWDYECENIIHHCHSEKQAQDFCYDMSV
jgi:hypothetical protein